MERYLEVTDGVNVEREVTDKLHFQSIIVNNLTDIEKAVLCLGMSGEYMQQDVSDILGLSHTTIWTINRNALKKLKESVNVEDFA